MTPQEQINEQAQIAIAKIKEALAEFNAKTGMKADVVAAWADCRSFESTCANHLLVGVSLEINEVAL